MTDAERDAEMQELKNRLELHEVLIKLLGCKFALVPEYGPLSREDLIKKLVERDGVVQPEVETATYSFLKNLEDTVKV